MSSNTIPLSVSDELLEAVKDAASDTHLSMADVMCQSMTLGLPRLREQFAAQSGRVTNVDPLPSKVLKRLYSQRDDDEDSIRLFMAAQAKHVEE